MSEQDKNDRIGEILSAISLLSDRIGSMDARIDRLESSVNARFDRLEGSVNARFDRLEARFGRLETIVTGIARKLLADAELRALGIDGGRTSGPGSIPGSVAIAAKPRE